MATVWIVFVATGLVLALGAWAVIRFATTGEQAPAFRAVARFLVALALGTAVFPALLTPLGVKTWLVAYIGFVAALTGAMTITAVVTARRESDTDTPGR
jgi:hypothetical protein